MLLLLVVYNWYNEKVFNIKYSIDRIEEEWINFDLFVKEV